MDRREIRAARLGPQGWLMFVLVASFVLVPVALMAFYAPSARGFVFAFSVCAFVLAWNRICRPETRGAEGTLHADAHELRFGELRVPTSSVRRVRVTPHGSGARVRVDVSLVRPPVWFEIPTVADARALAAAVGHDVGRTRERFAAYLPPGASFVVLLASVIVLTVGIRAAGWLEWAAVVGALAALFIAERYRYIEIGADGVFLRAPGGRTHLSASDLHTIRRGTERSGHRELVFSTRNRMISVWVLEAQAAAIESRVAELIASRKQQMATDSDRFLLRSVPELRAFGGQAATFRVEGIDRDTLLGIVENVHLAPSLRARAAVALPTDDADARARVRIVAARATLPELRNALDRSAADQAEVEDALASLDEAVRRFHER